ncbi:MAG: GreA/GreB family elongation factor [Candidatus Hydrogenedentes bacterium]|nr:GreA/GreB family elongation factor [Candidatus Hydrogenedentota bacterium]
MITICKLGPDGQRKIKEGGVMEKQIVITALDRHRILDCLYVLNEFPEKRTLPHIQRLEDEVKHATVILDPIYMPADVITMRSRAKLRSPATQEAVEWTLVYPAEGDMACGRVSILSPIGSAMIGCKVGDSFEADMAGGRNEFVVEEITYQPEATGEQYV